MRILKKKESLLKFGKRLKAIRESINISQEQVQYATGIGQSHLSKIEAGNLNIGLSHIAVLSEFFGLEEYELLQFKADLPDQEFVKRNVLKYLQKNKIDPAVFLKKGLAHILKNRLLPSKYFLIPRYSSDVAESLKDKYATEFTTSAISQALENLRKKGLVEKMTSAKKSKFLYKKR